MHAAAAAAKQTAGVLSQREVEERVGVRGGFTQRLSWETEQRKQG